MSKQVIRTDKAPAAIGPYSQAIKSNGFIFVSGQVPFDPSTGAMVEGGIAEQTEQVLKNVKAVIEAAGSSMDKVVKTTIFLADMNDFTVVNETYARHFTTHPPARATVQVSRLPRDAKVEIEAVAIE